MQVENDSSRDERASLPSSGDIAKVDPLVERVAIAICNEIAQPAYAALDEVPPRDAALGFARGLAEAAVESSGARDLLKALKALITQRDTPHGFPDNDWYEPGFAAARAAIAKAESR